MRLNNRRSALRTSGWILGVSLSVAILAADPHGLDREAVDAAEKTVGLVGELYRSGLVDFQGVLDSQRQLSQYQDALAQSMGQSAAGLVSVYKAFGGGWSAEGE